METQLTEVEGIGGEKVKKDDIILNVFEYEVKIL